MINEAEEQFNPPFNNCKFKLCDLPGQCRSEGKCHHPVKLESKAEVYQCPRCATAMEADRTAKPLKAEKQEPAFFVVVDETGSPEYTALWPEFCHEHINTALNEYLIDGVEKWKVVPVYTAPPDRSAEVEFMQGKYEEMLDEWLPQKNRIAELEAVLEKARNLFESERKAISKGGGSHWQLLQCHEQITNIDEVLK